jgi:type I restriction enzyme S subunit
MSSKAKTTTPKPDGKPALMPRLRFPEFRDAEGWESEPMGEVYSFKGNNSLSRDKLNYDDGSVKNIHYGDIHTKFSTHFDITKEKVPFINESEMGTIRDENFCNEGDMVFADASEDLADIGKNIELVSLNNEKVVSGLHTILARQSGKSIALGFGGHLFKSRWVRTQIQKEAQGAKVLGISATRLRRLLLPLPPTPAEQQKIAECLSSVDELIAAQARKLDALKTHKKGLMQQFFPREGETQPRLRFPEFQNAGEWKVDLFDKLIEVVDGDRGVNYPKAEEFSQSGFCIFLSAKNVTKTGFKFEEMQFLSKEKDEALRKGKLKRADVVLTTRGTVGQFAYYSKEIPYENIRINSGMVILRIKTKQIVHDYLYGFTSSDVLSSYIKNIAFGNAQQQLTVAEIKKFQLYYPGPDEQQRIADCLTSLDDLITAQTQKLEALKTHKKGLMQQLFPSPEEVEA